MKKTLITLLIFNFGLYACKSEKKYWDYDEADFYEVQGIIKNISLNNNPFDISRIKNVSYTYFLDRSIPISGVEKNIDLSEINSGYYVNDIENGYPILIYVHKNDENISFCGPIGILDSLNTREKEFLTNHFQNKMKALKKETPNYIYDAILKDKQSQSE